MGEVWKARDTRLNRQVAIKRLNASNNARFAQEAHAISAMNHPNICQIYDIGPDYLVLEYIDGKPLSAPLPAEEVVRLGLQIVGALEEAHAHGILHRDLKPANILVTSNGTVKLLDFGLAKHLTESEADLTQTKEGTIAGTAAYMSPEQAQGRAVDARSDVFSFGAVLYEMASGRRAFSGSSMLETLNSVVNGEPAPLDCAAKAVVQRCLAKDPSQRFQSMAEIRAALEHLTSRTGEQQASIAVLPFTNMSRDPDDGFFSDGLAEEILNALTQVPGLRVVARASAFAFRGREHAIAEIAGKLRVRSVLHGSVRRAGNRLRITAQLINVSDETQLWSERYDREMVDIFDVQDEIAQAIVAKLKVQLKGTAAQRLVRRYTDNQHAHSLYLKGNFHLYRFTAEDMEKGRAFLEEAVAIEPAYAPAWVQLADYYIASAFLCTIPPSDALPKGLEAARSALDADHELAEAHAVFGWADGLMNYNWADTLRRLDTAIRLNPASARARFWRCQTCLILGRLQEAMAEIRRAVDLDPLSTLFGEALAMLHMFSGEIAEAIEQCRHVRDLNPHGADPTVCAEAYSLAGRHEEALATLAHPHERVPGEYWSNGLTAWVYLRAGRRPDAERFLHGLREKSRHQYTGSAVMAVVAAGLGKSDEAFEYAHRAVRDRDPNLLSMLRSPYLQPLVGDPRYAALLRQMNLA